MYEYPPEQNWPPPAGGDRTQRLVDEICGQTDSGMPRVRLVWGQSRHGEPFASTYYARDAVDLSDPGGNYLVYRYSRHMAVTLVEYTRDLAGKVVGEKHYAPDQAPPGRILDARPRWAEVGLPFWYLEEARFIDEKDWASDGAYTILPDGGAIDHGPYPVGGIIYDTLWQISEHNTACACGQGALARPLCDGLYRDPSQVDLDELRRRWREREREQRLGDRDLLPQSLVDQGIRDRRRLHEEASDRHDAHWAGEYRASSSWCSADRIRLAAGTGQHDNPVDLQKYVVLGAPTTAGDNLHVPKFSQKLKEKRNNGK